MPNGKVTKASFSKMTADSKLDVLYDHLCSLTEDMQELGKEDKKHTKQCAVQWHTCDARFKKTEKFVVWITGGLSGCALILSIVGVGLHAINIFGG